jgi:hypothetical protein
VKRTVQTATALLLVAFGGCALLIPAARPVSNDRCHVCHINYADEKLAVTHARHGVGCERCHGPSNEHCASEEHDRIYAHETVNSTCMQCHSKGELARKDMHNLNLVTTPTPKKHCTDTACHGTHRLGKRLVRWDKATRKLLPPS